MLRVLVADPDPAFNKAMASHLKTVPDVEVLTLSTTPEVLQQAGDLLFLSAEFPEALAVLEEIKRSRAETEVVFTAQSSKMETAVRAMKLGASDYLPKPLRPEQVAVAIDRARRIRRLTEENRELREKLAGKSGSRTLVGSTTAMQRIQDQIPRLAASDGSVLIVGEAGVEAESLSRAIHAEGARREQPFLRVDCGGPRPEAADQELFGSPGASSSGALVRAGGGMVHIHEVGELLPASQAALCAVLGDRVIRPAAGGKDVSFRARVTAFTSRNLLEAVGRGIFRQDLFERLSAATLALPPLRERLDDLPLLADAFLKARASTGRRAPRSVSAEAMATLLSYAWPGNVRELEQALERACELGEGEVLERRHLPPSVIQSSEERRRMGTAEITTQSLREMESEVIQKLLTENRGNTEIVSKLLKIDRSTLYRKIKRYKIDLDEMK